jgi:hypothetical protein
MDAAKMNEIIKNAYRILKIEPSFEKTLMNWDQVQKWVGKYSHLGLMRCRMILFRYSMANIMKLFMSRSDCTFIGIIIRSLSTSGLWHLG